VLFWISVRRLQLYFLMQNVEGITVTKVGKLPKDCYTDFNEFAQDLAKIMYFDVAGIAIAQGVDGKDGEPGQRGPKGDKGDKGDPGEVHVYVDNYDIPENATYIDIPIFTNWDQAIFQVKSKAAVGSPGPPDADPYDDPSSVGVGTIVLVHGTPVTHIRVYFVFSGGISDVPDDTFYLSVTRFSNQ
jgi:hypothetical protein